MKIIYLNLFEGCQEKERFQKFIEFINKHKPDILGLSELNDWDKNNFYKLNLFKTKTGFKQAVFCQAKTGYHLGLFSNEKIIESSSITDGFWHGVINAKVKFKNNTINLFLTHLCPNNEDDRLKEVDLLGQQIRAGEKTILMGDLNSLSPFDNYNEELLLKEMKKLDISKFGTTFLRQDVIAKVHDMGLSDALKLFSNKFEYSVPTTYNKDFYHFCKLRLDYIFTSDSLKKYILNTRILKDKETNDISDHFPIVAEFN